MAGVLVIVGTPLGNREDLSPRARAAILSADLLLCEDTRSPIRLFGDAAGLPPRRSCFVGNEHVRVDELLAALAEGKRVAYVSDAGMPCWSDPGERLVHAALEAGYAVDVVPGPTAVATAVALSGLPSSEVRFVGFPPRGGKPRHELLASLRHESATVVCYEAGNRTREFVVDLAGALEDAGTRRIAIAREMTKLHQEVLRGTVAELAADLPTSLLGEVTVVLGPSATRGQDVEQAAARAVLEVMLDASLKPRERARRLGVLTGEPAREIYARLGAAADDGED